LGKDRKISEEKITPEQLVLVNDLEMLEDEIKVFIDTSVKYRGLIKDKDLEQRVVVKEFGIKYLVYDRHFEGIEEYRTSREFVLAMELEAFESDY